MTAVSRLVSSVLSVAVCIALCSPAAGQTEREDARIQRSLEELETARDVLAALTNEEDIVLWEQRVELAEKEYENSKRLVELEHKEQTFAARKRIRLDYELEQAVSSVEALSAEADDLIQARRDEIKRLNGHKAHLEDQQEQDPTTEDGWAAMAEREARIRNLDAEILGLMLENDAAETHLSLTEEAKRIRAFLKDFDANPRITIRLLFDKRQLLRMTKQSREEFRMLAVDLEARIGETANAITLSRERAEGLDESIAILQDRYRVESPGLRLPLASQEERDHARRLRRMLDTSRSEQTVLAERIDHLERQHEALQQTDTLARQGMDLLDKETAFLENDTAVFVGRYMRQTLLPLGVVIFMVIMYTTLSRHVFPRFLGAEMLFITRRLGGYVLVLLIVLLLIAFFLEDLKTIATVMGILGAAIVIALQDLCSSFAGWFVIVACRKMKLGDRVEIGGHRGDVIDIQMLRITLLELNNWLGVDEPTGRIIVIPNSFIFRDHVFNYSHIHPYIAGRIDVTVTFETPAMEAYQLLLDILKKETKEEFEEAAKAEGRLKGRYGLVHPGHEPRVHTVIADSGVLFELFYVCHYRRYAATCDKISRRIVQVFDESPKINFAYPTERHIPTPEGRAFPVTVHKPGGRSSD